MRKNELDSFSLGGNQNLLLSETINLNQVSPRLPPSILGQRLNPNNTTNQIIKPTAAVHHGSSPALLAQLDPNHPINLR